MRVVKIEQNQKTPAAAVLPLYSYEKALDFMIKKR